jgi:polysaccharide export outer membrane protein
MTEIVVCAGRCLDDWAERDREAVAGGDLPKGADSMKRTRILMLAAAGCLVATAGLAQTASTPSRTAPAGSGAATSGAANSVVPAPGVVPPPGYVIGPDDILGIVFWREKDMSADVTVRPDGKISLPLLNDIQASGLTPEQLRLNVTEVANRLVEQPTVSVVVKTINSRKVFITGQVAKPGPYPLGAPTTVLQLIATAGGLHEYAESKKIIIIREENGKTSTSPFNYKDVVEGKNLKQNIELKPGDTVIVP